MNLNTNILWKGTEGVNEKLTIDKLCIYFEVLWWNFNWILIREEVNENLYLQIYLKQH